MWETWETIKESEIHYIKCECGIIREFTKEDVESMCNFLQSAVKYSSRCFCGNCENPIFRVKYNGDIQFNVDRASVVSGYQKFIKEY